MIFFSQHSYFRQIYLAGIFLLIVALPLSMFLMSLAQFILLGAWILDGNIVKKLKSAFANPFFVVLAGVFVLHILGLINTTDFNYAYRDIRVKLPLLLLPLIIVSSAPLETNHFNAMLKFFIASVFISTLISIAVYVGIIHKDLHNIRDISIFISHIRLALLVCVAIVCCIYFFNSSSLLKIKILLIAIIIYLTAFLLLLESLTGLTVLICLLIFFAIRYLLKQSRRVAGLGVLFIVAIIVFATNAFYRYVFVDSIKQTIVNHKSLPKFTALGNAYLNDTAKQDLENGNLVWITVCEKELDSTWNARSKFLFLGKDVKGQNIKYTLIRFLASKNLTRDAAGVLSLTVDEVRAVENGIANVNDVRLSDVSKRIHNLGWEYRQYYYNGSSSGHSVIQRIEFWKTALYIISKHPLTGVGTGDVQIAFDRAYQENNSTLEQKSRLRAHNQYLTMAVAFGVLGGVYFIFCLLFPLLLNRKLGFLYSSFLLIALLSMINEDTLETQAGVTFFTFFNVLLFNQAQMIRSKQT